MKSRNATLLIYAFCLMPSLFLGCGDSEMATESIPTVSLQGQATTVSPDESNVSSQAGAPDLFVEHLLVRVDNFCQFSLTAIVTNQGGTAVTEDFVVFARLNGANAGFSKLVTKTVRPGGSVRVPLFSKSALGTGTFTFGAEADVFDAVAEESENNNFSDELIPHSCP